MDGFRWNTWNIEHIGEHGVSPEEAEEVVVAAADHYPEKVGDEKFRIRGQTAAGRYLQVIYIIDPPRCIYVIHARDLTFNERRLYRRRRK